MLPSFSSHKNKIRNVRASDQQHHAECPHQHPERRGGVAHNVALKRSQARPQPAAHDLFLGASRTRRETVDCDRDHATHIRAGLLQSDPWLETGDATPEVITKCHLTAIEAIWSDDIDLLIQKPK